MNNSKLEKLKTTFHNKSYNKGCEIAEKDRKESGQQFTDPNKAFSHAEGLWMEESRIQTEFRGILSDLKEHRDDEDWIHIYTEVRVGFENGYTDSILN